MTPEVMCKPNEIRTPDGRCLMPACPAGQTFSPATGQCMVLVPAQCQAGEMRTKDGRCALPGVQAGQSCQVVKVDIQPACSPAQDCADPSLAIAMLFTVVMRCVP